MRTQSRSCLSSSRAAVWVISRRMNPPFSHFRLASGPAGNSSSGRYSTSTSTDTSAYNKLKLFISARVADSQLIYWESRTGIFSESFRSVSAIWMRIRSGCSNTISWESMRIRIPDPQPWCLPHKTFWISRWPGQKPKPKNKLWVSANTTGFVSRDNSNMMTEIMDYLEPWILKPHLSHSRVTKRLRLFIYIFAGSNSDITDFKT